MLHVPHDKHAIQIVLLISILVLLFATPSSAWLIGYDHQYVFGVYGSESLDSNITNYQILLQIFNTTGYSHDNVIYTNGNTQVDWGV